MHPHNLGQNLFSPPRLQRAVGAATLSLLLTVKYMNGNKSRQMARPKTFILLFSQKSLVSQSCVSVFSQMSCFFPAVSPLRDASQKYGSASTTVSSLHYACREAISVIHQHHSPDDISYHQVVKQRGKKRFIVS